MVTTIYAIPQRKSVEKHTHTHTHYSILNLKHFPAIATLYVMYTVRIVPIVWEGMHEILPRISYTVHTHTHAHSLHTQHETAYYVCTYCTCIGVHTLQLVHTPTITSSIHTRTNMNTNTTHISCLHTQQNSFLLSTLNITSQICTYIGHVCVFPVLPEEDVVDVFPDVRSKSEKLAVDPVKEGLEEVPLPAVLGVKQLQQLHHKRLVYVSLCHRCVELRALEES